MRSAGVGGREVERAPGLAGAESFPVSWIPAGYVSAIGMHVAAERWAGLVVDVGEP